jgi:Zn-finger nucleic acid-binding protein
MANCPKCPNSELRHTLLMDDLPAYGCSSCDGLLLSLMMYRHWRETESVHLSESPTADLTAMVADRHEPIKCPRCRSLMTKYRISADIPNRVDYCAHCEDIWFDPGEWKCVEAIARSGHFAEIFGRPWQRQIHRKISEEMETQRLKELLGSDYGKFADFREWFQSHPNRGRLLALLSRKRV